MPRPRTWLWPRGCLLRALLRVLRRPAPVLPLRLLLCLRVRALRRLPAALLPLPLLMMSLPLTISVPLLTMTMALGARPLQRPATMPQQQQQQEPLLLSRRNAAQRSALLLVPSLAATAVLRRAARVCRLRRWPRCSPCLRAQQSSPLSLTLTPGRIAAPCLPES
jgi:hypothetical protein